MSELNKHYLVYDRPHIYKCSCGCEVLMNIFEGKYFEKVYALPRGKIEYLPCGHAVCAKKQIDGKEQCVICLNTGGDK